MVRFWMTKESQWRLQKKNAAENIAKSQEKQKQAYAKRVHKKYQNKVYQVGDEVLLFNMRKRGRKGGRMEPDFFGPYVIRSICGRLVTLSNSEGTILKNKYKVNHIKPCRRSHSDGSPVPSKQSYKIPEEKSNVSLPTCFKPGRGWLKTFLCHRDNQLFILPTKLMSQYREKKSLPEVYI